MNTDELLLNQYATEGDPIAFRELVDRYTGLVYGIGLRVTGDRQMAEDVSQDCFLELARKARMVQKNVAGWLHAVATSRSLNVVRSHRRRANREKVAAGGDVAPAESSEGRELQLMLDRALNGLSDDLRLPIILHYLDGQSQQEVAECLQIDQATVSRRLQRGVEHLRQRLRSFGVMTTVVALTSVLGQGTAQAASASLPATLTKIGLSGVGVTVAKTASGGIYPILTILGVVAGNVAAFLLLNDWVCVLLLLVQVTVLIRRPSWYRELMQAHASGRDLTDHLMWPYRRWTWTIPPVDWKQELATTTLIGLVFGLGVLWNLVESSTAPGYVVVLGLIAAGNLAAAARIVGRVWTCRQNLGLATDADSREPYRAPFWYRRISRIVIGVAAVLMLSTRRETQFTPQEGTIALCIIFIVIAGAFRSILRRRRDE